MMMQTEPTTPEPPKPNNFNGLSYDVQLPLTLCSLAAKGDVNAIRALIPNLTIEDLSKGDYDNRTPLHLAAEEGHLEAVKLLVDFGAEVNAVDRWGGTPLNGALKNSHIHIVRYLKKHGARLDAEYRERETGNRDIYPL